MGCAEGQGRTETRPRPVFSETPQNGVRKDAAAVTALEKSAQTVLAEAASPGRCSCGALSQGASPGGEEGGAPHAQTDAPAPQAHRPFYASLLALARAPRRLQHLCRCAIRRRLGRKCFHLVPLSPVPKSLQNYLLLEPEGVLH